MSSLRDLPAVNTLAAELPKELPSVVARDIARTAIDETRAAILMGRPLDSRDLAQEWARRLLDRRPRSVINATGVLLHTNLGRAPLHPDAAEAARTVATAYSNLEIELDTGRRGGRGAYAHALLRALTGAKAALVVGNNAGALFLTLAALATGGEVPVSRGELIEIGGSYRLPELMKASGAALIEVGTTNRTRLSDYRTACTASTAILLKVHPSNYRIAGFTEEAALSELVSLGSELDVPVVFDAGSGLLDAQTPWLSGPPPAWLAGEPGVAQSLHAGADLVLFSGDKLLGGPQAGIIVGNEELVGRVRRHPVARAMRIDGPNLAALIVTLERYAAGDATTIPFWRMATYEASRLEARCRSVIEDAGIEARVETRSSTLGAGSVPGSEVPSPAIVISGSTDRRYVALLQGHPPVVARREEGKLVVDLRAVPADRDRSVAEALGAACRS